MGRQRIGGLGLTAFGAMAICHLGLVASHYPMAGPEGGRPSMPLETTLRVYFPQNWYALSTS